MGVYMTAYMNVDQNEIKSWVKDKNLNPLDAEDQIALIYSSKYCQNSLKLLCEWDDSLDFYRIYANSSGGWTLDDRFKNLDYIAELERKYGGSFPKVLKIYPTIVTPQDAIEAADGLELYFPADYKLQKFVVPWLRLTAKYCHHYEFD